MGYCVCVCLGEECCAVEWERLWQRIMDILVTVLSAITVMDQSNEPKDTQLDIESLTELWHLAMRGI